MLRTMYGGLLIKHKIFALTFLIITSVSAISMTAVHYATEIYEDKIYREAAETLNLSSTSVDNELRAIERWSFQILSDKKLQADLARLNESENEYELYRAKDSLLLQLTDAAQQERAIASIQLIDAQGRVHTASITNKPAANLDDTEMRAKEAAGANVWLPSSEPNALVTAKQIREVQNLSLRHLGVLIVHVDMNRLVDQTLDLSDDKMFLIEYKDRTVLGTVPGLAEAASAVSPRSGKGHSVATLDGKKVFVTYLTSPFQQFTYYNIIGYHEIFYQSRLIKFGLLGLYSALLVVALVVARQAAASIASPLERLTHKAKQVQKGNFDTEELFPERELNMDETGHLHRHFRLMLERINELIRDNYAKQLAVKEAEYQALQAQMNPHFLYNTLDSINWMAKMNRQTEISRTVEALGSLLRGVIGHSSPLVTVREEMKLVEDYITIQRARFGERLGFRAEIEPGLEACGIPKLTIQPLVENAIQYGLEAMSEPCLIEVKVSGEEEHLCLRVSDNGPGMSRDTLESLFASKAEGMRTRGTGIGLRNIRERVHLLFGAEYGVEAVSTPGELTTITIRLPYQLETEG
ncbi:histidine kinase [Paenibacillus sp. TRM 82003]|nr:histidine kinase [Paenibacillus sp. TRM 82003]